MHQLKSNLPSSPMSKETACKNFKPNVIHCGDRMLAVTGLNIDTVASVSNKLEAGGELLQIVKWARLAQIDNRSDRRAHV